MCVSVVHTGLKDAMVECESVSFHFPTWSGCGTSWTLIQIVIGSCMVHVLAAHMCQGLHSTGAIACAYMYTHRACADVWECVDYDTVQLNAV